MVRFGRYRACSGYAYGRFAVERTSKRGYRNVRAPNDTDIIMGDYSGDQKSAYNDLANAGVFCQIDREGATIDVPALLETYSQFAVDGNLILATDIRAMIPGMLERNPDPS